MKFKIKQEHILEIKKIGINGEGIGYIEKMPFFVYHTIPGEIVKVEITEVFENRVEAKLIEIVKKSDDRVEITNMDLQLSGAFEFQHIKYDRQVKLKRDLIIQALQRYYKKDLKYQIIKKTVKMDNPFNYRNKVSLPIRKIKGSNKFGFYERGTNNFIEGAISKVHDENINSIIITLEKLINKYRFDAYINKDKSGYLKSVVIRRTLYKNEVQISFLLMRKFENINLLITDLINNHPNIKSVYQYFTNNYKEQIFFTSKYQKLYGEDFITENMNNYNFYLYPESFFQINTVMAEKFYQKIVEYAKPNKEDIVIDAYSGIGMVSIYISKYVKKVYAIDNDFKSHEGAKLSVKNNNLENIKIIKKDFYQGLLLLENTKIDLMIFDPPRTGLGEKVIGEILKYLPKKIVYGSCNPSTLAKDLKLLEKHYDLVEITPFDMFPYTTHIESISLLVLK